MNREEASGRAYVVGRERFSFQDDLVFVFSRTVEASHHEM